MYLVAGLGFLPTVFPLFVIRRRAALLKGAGIASSKHYLLMTIFSIASITMAFLAGDVTEGEGMLDGGLFLLVTCAAKYGRTYSQGWHRDALHSLPPYFLRACIVFLLIYLPVYLFYIHARLSFIGETPVLDRIFDIVFGITAICFLLFAWFVAKHRIGKL